MLTQLVPGFIVPARTPWWKPIRKRRRLKTRNAVDPANFSDLGFVNPGDYNTVDDTTSEESLIDSTPDNQPTFPAGVFLKRNRTVIVEAAGTISNTSTPTIIFTLRLGSVLGPTDLTGTQIGVSPTITTQSGVSNKAWFLRYVFSVRTPGQGAGGCTISGVGAVWGRGWMGAAGFDFQPMEATTPDTATWTATINGALQNYLNLSATWGTANASNAIICKHLTVQYLN